MFIREKSRLERFLRESLREDCPKRELRLSDDELRSLHQLYPRACCRPCGELQNERRWYAVSLRP